jgi:hypothetical protein
VLSRSICTGVVLLLALLAAPSAHALPARDIAGVALHPWQVRDAGIREKVFAGVAASGARWVRVDLPWSWVEPDGPTVQAGHGNWAAIDAIVQAADRQRLQLLPMLAYTPKWASSTGDSWTFPNGPAFEAFFAAALRRYPQIPAWELWNEPNLERFSTPAPDPAGFVELLRAARRARDHVGSRAKLISGGVAPGGAIDIVPWVEQMAVRGALDLVDGLGVHPYSAVEPDDPRAWMMQLEGLHQRLAFLGHADLPLWVTEYGAPTATVTSGYGPPLTEGEQADRLRTAFAVAVRQPWIENLTWYEYRESCNVPTDPECRFGLVRPDLSPKPAYHALRDVVSGATARVRPQLQVSSWFRRARVRVARRARGARGSRRRTRRRRVVNRITVSGKLTLPGTPWPNALLTLLLPRRQGPARPVTVLVKEGVFWTRFEGPQLRPGTLEARYPGSAEYKPLAIQAPVTAGP